VDSRGAQGAERGGVQGGVPLPARGGSGRGLDPFPEKFFLLFDLKIEHFGAVFKLDLTEETRTQLQEEEVIASSCLILATPMHTGTYNYLVTLFKGICSKVRPDYYGLLN